MAGKPGRSGGARPNSGPKPKKVGITGDTPLEFLLAVMQDVEADAQLRIKAAIAAAQYCHPKAGESGKVDEKRKAAEKAANGKFAPAAPPKLVVNNQ